MPYSVGEAAKMLGVTPSTLRYYESEGLLGSLARSEGGRRVFSERDLEACRVIECLKTSGLSIKEIARFMDMVEQGDASLEERLELFKARRDALLAQMDELRRTLDVLEYKCWYYETAAKAGTEEAVSSLAESRVPTRVRAGRRALEG